MTTAQVGCLALPLAPPPVRDGVLAAMSRMSGTTGFPGGNPVSIERRNLPQLAAEPYAVCPKTDGTRAALVCATLQDNLLVVALVTRALEVFVPRFEAVNRAAFQGTLLDVEIIKNLGDEGVDLLVFDAVCACGAPVASHTLHERMMAARLLIEAWPATPHDGARLRVKRFYSTAQELLDLEGGVPYSSDGLVLTPCQRPNIYGRNELLYKWKEKHTVDFLLGSDGQTLLVYDATSGPGKHRAVGRLDRVSFAGAIMECGMVTENVWYPIVVRTDKKRANDIMTFQRTVGNAKENIQKSEILHALKR